METGIMVEQCDNEVIELDNEVLGAAVSDEEFSSSIDGSSSSTDNVLNRLRCPSLSELARKRRIDRNPPRGKRWSRGRGVSDPKSVTPQQQVATFSGEHLSVSNNKLFCSACREELSVKCSVVCMHLLSAKHKSSKERLSMKKTTEKDNAMHYKLVTRLLMLKERHCWKNNGFTE